MVRSDTFCGPSKPKIENKTWYVKSRVGAQDVTFAAGLPYPLLLGLCLPLLYIKDLY